MVGLHHVSFFRDTLIFLPQDLAMCDIIFVESSLALEEKKKDTLSIVTRYKLGVCCLSPNVSLCIYVLSVHGCLSMRIASACRRTRLYFCLKMYVCLSTDTPTEFVFYSNFREVLHSPKLSSFL